MLTSTGPNLINHLYYPVWNLAPFYISLKTVKRFGTVPIPFQFIYRQVGIFRYIDLRVRGGYDRVCPTGYRPREEPRLAGMQQGPRRPLSYGNCSIKLY